MPQFEGFVIIIKRLKIKVPPTTVSQTATYTTETSDAMEALSLRKRCLREQKRFRRSVSVGLFFHSLQPYTPAASASTPVASLSLSLSLSVCLSVCVLHSNYVRFYGFGTTTAAAAAAAVVVQNLKNSALIDLKIILALSFFCTLDYFHIELLTHRA